MSTLDSLGTLLGYRLDGVIGGTGGETDGDMEVSLGLVITLLNIATKSYMAANFDGVLVNGNFGDGCFIGGKCTCCFNGCL